MDLNLDLTNFTLLQVFGFGALIAILDTLGAMVLAVVHGNFSAAAVALWLQSHVLKRIFPIFSLAVVGNGVPTLDIPPIPPAFGLALAGLAAYAIETIKSITDSFRDTTPPTDTTPVPSP